MLLILNEGDDVNNHVDAIDYEPSISPRYLLHSDSNNSDSFAPKMGALTMYIFFGDKMWYDDTRWLKVTLS